MKVVPNIGKHLRINLLEEVERSLVLNFKLSDSEVSLRAGVGYGWGREGCCQVVKYDKASFRQN